MRMQILTGVNLHMGKFTPGSDQMQNLFLQIYMCKFYNYVPCERKVKLPMSIFISSQYLLLDNEFFTVLFLTNYKTAAETVGIVPK